MGMEMSSEFFGKNKILDNISFEVDDGKQELFVEVFSDEEFNLGEVIALILPLKIFIFTHFILQFIF
jgi:hypothetical protein